MSIDKLAFQLQALGVKPGEREFRFHPVRKWRFDLAWPAEKLALECDGGVFTGGRHIRGAGYREDCVKLSTAAAMGWRVLRVMPEHIKSGQAVEWVEQALNPCYDPLVYRPIIPVT